MKKPRATGAGRGLARETVAGLALRSFATRLALAPCQPLATIVTGMFERTIKDRDARPVGSYAGTLRTTRIRVLKAGQTERGAATI